VKACCLGILGFFLALCWLSYKWPLPPGAGPAAMLIRPPETNRVCSMPRVCSMLQDYTYNLWGKISREKILKVWVNFYRRFKMIISLSKMGRIKKIGTPDTRSKEAENRGNNIVKSGFPVTKTALFEIFQRSLFVKGQYLKTNYSYSKNKTFCLAWKKQIPNWNSQAVSGYKLKV